MSIWSYKRHFFIASYLFYAFTKINKAFLTYSPFVSSRIVSGGTNNNKFSTWGNEYVHPSVVTGFSSNLQECKCAC